MLKFKQKLKKKLKLKSCSSWRIDATIDGKKLVLWVKHMCEKRQVSQRIFPLEIGSVAVRSTHEGYGTGFGEGKRMQKCVAFRTCVEPLHKHSTGQNP